jgi:UDP-3-O-[3-hydroxymyristoyl] glucosamine N-acyltransferase
MRSTLTYSLRELISGLDATIVGDAECRISGVAILQDARAGQIAFLTNSLYKKYLPAAKAAAVILEEKFAADCPVTKVIASNPHYIYSQIARYFEVTVSPYEGIHPTVILGKGYSIHPTVSIAAGCVLGENVVIGANAIIEAGTVIGNHVSIGAGTILNARVTLYDNVVIGERSHILSGAIIGSDGFGFALHRGSWHRVPQMGAVVVGNDVTVGANTVIDRGAIGDTLIGHGVKLDNLIQIAHNVCIGDNTIIAGCVAVAGSSSIGKNCMIGGATCISGHLSICDGVIVTGMSSVTKSISEPGMYSSGIVGVVPNHEFRKQNARFHRLENLMQRVKTLETEIKKIAEETK